MLLSLRHCNASTLVGAACNQNMERQVAIARRRTTCLRGAGARRRTMCHVVIEAV